MRVDEPEIIAKSTDRCCNIDILLPVAGIYHRHRWHQGSRVIRWNCLFNARWWQNTPHTLLFGDVCDLLDPVWYMTYHWWFYMYSKSWGKFKYAFILYDRYCTIEIHEAYMQAYGSIEAWGQSTLKTCLKQLDSFQYNDLLILGFCHLTI